MPRQGVRASSEFRIFETDEFVKCLTKLPPRESGFLQRKLRDYVYPQLRQNPFLGPNIRRLKGYAPATWRYRIGKLRVFFIVDQAEKTIFVLSADYRKDAY